jgi:hypothetical protein
MPLLNPKRILTPNGKAALLAVMMGDAVNGPFFEAQSHAVVDVEIEALTDEITSRTLGTHGLQTNRPLGDVVAVLTSSAGKVYAYTDPITYSVTSPTGSQAVKGILLSTDGTAAGALAYLELDDEVVLDQTGEGVIVSVEFGFDGQSFYIVPRVLPLGT